MSRRHRTRVDADRWRVVCLDCTWFLYAQLDDRLAPGLADRLAQYGRNHTHAVDYGPAPMEPSRYGA